MKDGYSSTPPNKIIQRECLISIWLRVSLKRKIQKQIILSLNVSINYMQWTIQVKRRLLCHLSRKRRNKMKGENSVMDFM